MESTNFDKFKELEKQAKEFVTINNIDAFNLGVSEGIDFSVKLIDRLLDVHESIRDEKVLIVIDCIKKLKETLLWKNRS